MKKQILLALLFSFFYLGVNAQFPCTDPGDPPPGTTCDSAPLFCEGIPNGYCFSTYNSGAGTNPGPFCGGNSSVQNNLWFSFMAGTPTIDLEVSVGSCNTGDGLQGLVYDGCGPPWNPVSNCFFQMPPGSTNTYFLTGLNPGSVYYLMIDGFSGDNCEFAITTTGGSTVAPPVELAGSIAGPAVVCPGADPQTYTVPAVGGAGFYDWVVTGGGTIIGAADGNSITVDWGNSAGGTITVTPNNQCNTGVPSAPFTVTSQDPPPNPPQMATLCDNDPPVVIEGETYSWAPGVNTYDNFNVTNALGCPILTPVIITGALDMTENLDPMVICQEDPPVEVGGQFFSTTGPINVTIPSYLGCDSTITSFLTVLEPSAGIWPLNAGPNTGQPAVVTCDDNVVLNAVVINQDPSVIYNWSGPCIEPTGNPTGPSTEVSCGGTYTLTVIESQDGVTCVSTQIATIAVPEDMTTPIADAGPPAVIDCSGSVSLGGPNTTSGATYSWFNTIPGNGYSSASQNPTDVTQPGTYCLTVFDPNNGCISAPSCVEVTGDATPPTAMGGTDNNILTCANGSATLNTTGSTTGTGFVYTWTGPNGTLTGSNPTVMQGGTYTLIVSNPSTNCESTPFEVVIDSDQALPDANIADPSAIDCNTTTVTLNGGSSTGNGLSYNWSTGGTSSTTDVMSGGTYTLTVTGSNGCEDITTVMVPDNTAALSASIDVQGQLTCSNNMVTLTATNVSGTNNPTYLWTDPDGNPIPGTDGSSSIMVAVGGNYSLVIQDNSNGCASTMVTEFVASNTDLPTATAGSDFTTLDCNNTSATLNPSGSATGNVTYTWTGPNGTLTGDNPTVMEGGTYTLIVTNNDSNCDSEPATVVINTDQALPDANIADPAAIDCSTTTVTLNGGGSTGTGLSYNWSTGSTSPTTDVMSDGTYTLTVTGSNGCEDITTVMVNDNSAVLTAGIDVQGQITCDNGMVTLVATNVSGTTNPTYIWTDPDGNPIPGTDGSSSIMVNTGGDYSLVIQDNSNGCASTMVTELVVSNMDLPTATAGANFTTIDCNNNTAILDPAGSSTGNITYTWTGPNGALTGSNPSITEGGTYTLTVFNNDTGCDATETIVILDDFTPPTATIVDPIAIDCNNPTITLDGGNSSGSGALSYAWSNGGSSNGTLDISSDGTYTLTVTAANGCTDEATVTVVDNTTTVDVSATASNIITCNELNSVLNIATLTGSNNPTYEWLDENNNVVGNGTDSAPVTEPGTYTLNIVDGTTGCTGSTTVVVIEDADLPTSVIDPPANLTCTQSTVNLDGSGSSTGNNYVYQWFVDGNPVASGTSNLLSVTTAGNYTLVVTDTINGCEIESAIAPVILDDQAPTAIAIAGNGGVISCDIDNLTIDGSTSTGNGITYQWTDATGNILGNDPTLDVASSGDYILTVFNSNNGCDNQTTVTVTPDANVPSLDVDPILQIDCINQMTDLIGTGTSSDPNGTVTFQWLDENDVEVSNTGMYQTSTPGTYTFVVTDPGNGCSQSQPFIVEENLDQPSVDPGTPQVIDCNNSMVTLNGSNSSSGNDITYQWLDPNNDPVPGGNSAIITTNISGQYTLVVTDNSNGCESSLPVMVDENLQQPELGGMAANNIDCNNTDVLVQGQVINSFSTDLTYQWTNSSGGILSSAIDATVSSEGTVTLTVTDNENGCTSTFDVPVINTTADPEVTAIASDNGIINCNISQITLDGSGSLDSTGITYSWTLGGNEVSTDLAYTTSNPGLYILEVINGNNGCTSTVNVLVEEDTELPTTDVSASIDLLTCSETTSTLNGANSSTGDEFIYEWVDVITGNTISTDITFDVSVASTYELIVTDTVSGCVATSAQLVIDQSSDIPVAASIIQNGNNLDCNNSEVTLDGSSSTGIGTLTYEWLDPDGNTIGNTPTITVSTPGAYILNIIDGANGCDVSANPLIVEEDLAQPVVDAGIPTTLNCNQPTYTLDGTSSNLDPAITYSYEWTLAGNSVGTTLSIPDVTVGGTYQLEIINTENGCSNISEVVIDEDFEAPTADAGNNFTITCADINAPLDGSASSAMGNFSYVWVNELDDTVSTSVSDIINVPGEYTLIVTNDDNGCSSISSPIEVDINATLPTVDLMPAPMITCFNDQFVTLDGSGSDSGAGITYQWTLDGNDLVGETSVFLNTNQPGDYVLEIFNANTGCGNAAPLTVLADLDAPIADAGTGGTLICGQTSLQLDGAASSSNGNFSYEWFSYDVANATIQNQVGSGITFDAGAAGDYVIVVTNTDNGCSSVSLPVQIDQDENVPNIDVAPAAPLNCNTDVITVDGSASSVSMISTGSLVYEWTDANGNVIGTGPTVDVMNPGSITLLITDDANNCQSTTDVVILEDIEEPIANAGVEATLFCNSTDVTLDGGGSATNMDYQWLDPNGMPVGSNSTTLTTAVPGIYTLVVTNPVNGCDAESTVEVLQDVNLPTAATIFTGEFNCNVDAILVDGSTSVAAGGGDVTYAWSDGSNSATTTFMAAGDYTLTVTDALNGCSSISTFTIGEDFSTPIIDIAGISNTTITCDNSSLVYNGSNSTSSTGGAITYEWYLDGNLIEDADEIEVSSAGDLVLVVTNVDNGCSASSAPINIGLDADLPNIEVANPDVLSCIENTVTLDGTGSDTGADIEYLWTGPGTIENETTLNPIVSTSGNYTLTLLNTATGCEISEVVFVDADIDLPQANANANGEFDCVTDEITLDGTGSATGGNITYTWTTSSGTFISGDNTFSPTISAPGEYTLVVTNSTNGCSNEAVVAVTANTDVPVIDEFDVTLPNCFGESNASILLDDVNGGQQPYLYSIDGNAFAPVNQFSFLSSGEYNIIVQDANGCESEVNITINEPAELQVNLGGDMTIGLGDTIDLAPVIQGAYDTIIWSNCHLQDCFTPVLDSLGPINTGQYGVTVIDGNGCTATDQITIFVEKGREVFIPNVFTPNGDGTNDRFWIFAGQEAIKVHEFRIFNRWGEQVYARTDFDPQVQTNLNGWDGTFDGKEMNPAVFVYYVDIEYLDGRRETLKGDVALRR